MDYTRNPRRLSALAMLAALAVAATATCADEAAARGTGPPALRIADVAAGRAGGAAGRDCAPSGIDVDVDGQPLTRAERIARLDAALNDSLARFDECQNAASVAAGRDAGAGGSTGGGAADGARNAGTPEAAEPAADGAAVESVAAAGVQGTEAPEGAGETTPGPERPPARDSGADSASGPGDVPDDIPEPDNDSVLEAQIRRAAMAETDPRVRAELWNEYRKYKGLPARPVPDHDGEPSDAQNSP